MKDDERQHLPEPIRRAKAALLELAAHTLVIIALLGAFWTVEKWVQFLWGPQERLLIGRIPLHYFFDVADALVLMYFLGYGGYLVIRAYLGK